MTEARHSFEIGNHVSDKHVGVLESRAFVVFITVFEIEIFLQFLLEVAAKNDERRHGETNAGNRPREVKAKDKAPDEGSDGFQDSCNTL